ncbi:MAG: YafY family transcriptional regulator [Clostridia bacterium]|nr:YafY family transcriptional regulator [Clostridia bacterium]
MKYETMVKILFLLLARGKVTAKYIAGRFDISVRTAVRYLDAIGLADIPLVSEAGRNGGYYISESYRLPSSFLSEDEFNAVIASLSSYNEQISSAVLSSAIEKISATKKQHSDVIDVKYGTLIIDGSSWYGDDKAKNVTSLMEKAIETCRVVKIRYVDKQGEETERLIEPHVMILKQGLWYVYAFCRLREEYRMFKLARIARADTLDETFERRENAFSSEMFKSWFEELETEYVDLEVDKRARPDVEEWLGIGAVYENSEGKFFASARLPYDRLLISKILGFGGNVKVLAPEKLKKDVALAAKEVYNLYG